MELPSIQINHHQLTKMINSQFYETLCNIQRVPDTVSPLLRNHSTPDEDLRVINEIVNTLLVYEEGMSDHVSAINVPFSWMTYLPYFVI